MSKNVAVLQPGKRISKEGKTIHNRILLAIPDAEYRLIRPELEHVALQCHHTLHKPDEKPHYAYFPNAGMLSLVVVMKNGKSVEAGIVGKEGIVGLGPVVGLTRNPLREIVQITGDGFKIPITVLHTMLESMPELRVLLGRYAVLHSLQVSQTAACNRLHDSEQRLSRWLLMTQDRVDTEFLGITHDFLATMLGTDRPTITLAAEALQKKRLIEYRRGSVKIVNRQKLEGVACECYGVVQQFNRELGLSENV